MRSNDSFCTFLNAPSFLACTLRCVLLLFVLLMVSSCSTEPSEGKIKVAIEKAHQNFIKIVSLSKGEEERLRRTIYRANFTAEVEWLDTATVRRSTNPLTNEFVLLIERGEKKSSASSGFERGFLNAILGEETIHRRGDREKISGRINCQKTWTDWECVLLSGSGGAIELGQDFDSVLRSRK